MMVIQIQQI